MLTETFGFKNLKLWFQMVRLLEPTLPNLPIQPSRVSRGFQKRRSDSMWLHESGTEMEALRNHHGSNLVFNDTDQTLFHRVP